MFTGQMLTPKRRRYKRGSPGVVKNTTLMMIPGGPSGTRQTLAVMKRLVNAAKKDFKIRELAMTIIATVPQKNWIGEIKAVQHWVRQNIRYTRDINNVETLHTPINTLKLGQGDCDDHAMLVAALLQSVGFPTRFHAIGFAGNRYAHVFTDAKLNNGKWVSVETTESWPVGKVPNGVKNHMFLEV